MVSTTERAEITERDNCDALRRPLWLLFIRLKAAVTYRKWPNSLIPVIFAAYHNWTIQR